MKRMLGLDHYYEQMREIGLTGTQFYKMSYPLIKKYIQTLAYVSLNKNQLKEMLRGLNQANKTSIQTLKALILINVTIHENVKQQKIEFDELITEEINALIAKEKSRYDTFQNKRTNKRGGFSIQKAGNWLKDRLSRSKDKPIQREARTMSSNNGITRNQTKTETTKMDTPKISRSQSVDGDSEVKGKQQVLISSVIIPYATYLLKLQSSQINLQKSLTSPHLKTQQIWQILNLLTYLMKTSESFARIMRYYKEDYEDAINAVIVSMHNELKLLYPVVEKTLNTKYDLLKKEIMEVYDKYGSSRSKVDKLDEIIFKYDVNEFKEIIESIAKLDQCLLTLYMGKYTYAKIKNAGLVKPTLITENNDNKFDVIYEVLKQVEKSKSAAKKLSSSKEKSKIMEKQKIRQDQFKKQAPPMKQSSFAQKKLRIVATGQKSIVIPKSQTNIQEESPLPPRQNQNSTFRRMRMNMTSSNARLEQSNTRRLRL